MNFKIVNMYIIQEKDDHEPKKIWAHSYLYFKVKMKKLMTKGRARCWRFPHEWGLRRNNRCKPYPAFCREAASNLGPLLSRKASHHFARPALQ